MRTFLAVTLSLGLGIQAVPDPSPDALRSRPALDLAVERSTFSDVTISPDGATVVFTVLGHLFRVPEQGGAAEQLTFGPSYDSDPVYSPDGSRIAFISDRDGSDGNVFVLDLGSGDISRISDTQRAARPVWTPDGNGIAFLSIERDLQSRGNLTLLRSRVMRAWLDGRETEALTQRSREFRALFHLADGRLAATELSRREQCPRAQGRNNTDRCYLSAIVLIDPAGPAILSEQDGILDRVVPGAAPGTFYARRPLPLTGFVPIGQPEHLVSGNFEAGVQWLLTSVDASGRGGTGRWHWSPRFAVSAGGSTLYFSDKGRLWRFNRVTGIREAIPFRAHVRVEAGLPVTDAAPGIAAAGEALVPRTVMGAQVLPDGSGIVFNAAGIIWRQALDGGIAERLTDGRSFAGRPLVSPDGRLLAYVRSWSADRSQVAVQRLPSGEPEVLYESGDLELADWNSSSDRLLVNDWDGGALLLSPDSPGTVEKLPGVPNTNELRFSPDRNGFVFSREYAEGDAEWKEGMPPAVGTVQRVSTGEPQPTLLTDYLPRLSYGRPSPDGRWMAFRRQLEIWVAPVRDGPVLATDLRRLSDVGGTDFRFSADGTAIVYSHGPRVWIHPLDGGERREIGIELGTTTPDPGPTVIRNVRVLDFAIGGFTDPTDVVVDRGRIAAVGDAAPGPDARVLDAGGRFAVPGFWNAHTHDGPISPGPLAYGVTSVRNLGTNLIAAAGAASDWLEASGYPAPRFFYAGPTLGATIANRRHPFVEVDEFVHAVEEWPDLGTGLLKAYAHLPWSWRRVIGPVAREAGVRVVSHGDDIEYIVRSVIDGFNGLEHGFAIPLYDDVFQLMGQSGIYWCPTLMAGGYPYLALMEPERMLDPRADVFWGREWRRVANHDFPAAASHGVLQDALTKLRLAWDNDVTMLVGTDRRFGPAVHWEMEMFARAGVPPIDIIRAATLNPARAAGVEADLGSIEPGKLADLVLLDEDPLLDITSTLRIWRVMKGGHLHDPAVLEARVRAEQAAAGNR